MSPFRPVAVSAKNRRISWDAVRAGCVVLVLVYHATYMSVVVHPELGARRFVFPHQIGASLLLVISAYFAAVTIGRGSLGRYWWGRVARLLPPFLAAVVVIFFALRYLSPPGWFVPHGRDLVGNLLMLWNWKPAGYPFLDGSHWTIPLQLMAFTVAALLYRGSWGHGRKLHVLMWAAVLVPLAQWPLRIAGPPEWYRILVDGFGLHRWHLFVAGVAVRLWTTKRLRTPEFLLLELACVAAHALHGATPTPTGLTIEWGATTGIALGLLVISLAAAGPDWDRFLPAFAQRAIQWFAGISYGVFLIHQAIGYLVLHWLSGLGFDPLLQTAGMLATGVLLGWALTRFVEQPAHRFLMRLPAAARPPAHREPVSAGHRE
ncbi:acyltransferase family protein [Amycolatopsis jejuensis]|uniref:acyltransferase family protein n=1 Tax=Amycolatopsis jejuensis TaxID=330084 RepID=UPI000A4CDC07|nr:acyltransferase [Amycolatopsis jejuensis]